MNRVHILGNEKDLDKVTEIFSGMTKIGYHFPGNYHKNDMNKHPMDFSVERKDDAISATVSTDGSDLMHEWAMTNAVTDVMQSNGFNIVSTEKYKDGTPSLHISKAPKKPFIKRATDYFFN